MATLGYELKQRREAKGISLTEISDATRIGVRFLQAIETDDYKALPGGLFNRSFIRAYARAVGLNEEDALSAYQRQTGAASPLSDSQLNAVPSYSSRENEINWVPPLTILVVIAMVGLGGWAIYNYFHRQTTHPNQSTVGSPLSPTSTTSNPDGPPPILTGGTPPPKPAVTVANTTAPAPLLLEFAASDECFIKADLDGEPSSFKLYSGDTRALQAKEKMVVRVGNLPGVVVKLNGKEVTLPSKNDKIADVMISLRDGAPVVEAIKRKIAPKPKKSDGAPTETPAKTNPQ